MEIANAEGEHAGPHIAAVCCQVLPPGLHQLQPSALGSDLLPFLPAAWSTQAELGAQQALLTMPDIEWSA